VNAWLVGFVGMAAVYALLLTAVVLSAARLAGRFPGWSILPAMLATLFFVFLTLHPFPAPGSVACPVPLGTPSLTPFAFWPVAARLWQDGAGPAAWLGNRYLLSTAMNYLLCALIGITLAWHLSRLRAALLAGLALTFAVELTQLTGHWGIYPCAIRQFNIDDLILNTLGVVSGFWLARRAGARPRRAAGS
jgi:hypothetical protein